MQRMFLKNTNMNPEVPKVTLASEQREIEEPKPAKAAKISVNDAPPSGVMSSEQLTSQKAVELDPPILSGPVNQPTLFGSSLKA